MGVYILIVALAVGLITLVLRGVGSMNFMETDEGIDSLSEESRQTVKEWRWFDVFSRCCILG